MIIGGRNVDRVLGPGQGSGRYSRFGEGVALVGAVAFRPFGHQLAAVDHQVGLERIPLDGLGMFREQQVGENDHRELVLVRQIQGLGGGVVGLGHVGRSHDDAGEIALGSPQGLVQIGLLGLGGNPGRRTAALDRNEHDRRFDHAGLTHGLGHQGKPAARSGAHGASPGQSGADSHVGDRDFVLALLDHDPAAVGMSDHPVQDGGSGRHGVGGIELAAGGDRTQGHGFVSGNEGSPDAAEVPFIPQGHEFFLGVVIARLGHLDVLVDHFLALVLEGVGQNFGHHLEIQPQKEDGRAQRYRVLHDGKRFPQRLQQLPHGHRHRQNLTFEQR